MEWLVASGLGLLVGCGVYLMLRARTFSVVLGLSLLSYGVNGFVFVMGRLVQGAPALVGPAAKAYADPLPQALVLTAIVIGLGMTGFLVELALRASRDVGSDHVDAGEPEDRR